MKATTSKYYAVIGFLAIRTGHIFKYEDVRALNWISRLQKAHHRQCENSCNGNGYIPRRGFFTCATNDTDKHETRSAYVNDEETVFDVEIERLEKAILRHAQSVKGISLEFQHDPRGSTVKLYYKGKRQEQIGITDLLYI